MNDDGKGPSEEKQPCMKRARATASWQDIDNPAKKKRTTHGGNKFLRNALPTGWKEETKHRQGGLRKGQAYGFPLTITFSKRGKQRPRRWASSD